MSLVPSLSIERAVGVLRYRLDVPEHDLHEPILQEFRQPVDEATLRALLASAEALLRSPESKGFRHEAEARGQVLYRTLIPRRLREKLRLVTGPLLISTSLYGLPWELLHDEQEFWGLRYALGKRLVLDRPMLAGPPPRLRARPRILVIGSDPRGDLPFVRREAEEICETLEGAADLVCVVDRLATFETVSTYLSEGFDVVHYCGHVVTGPETGPALLLAEERPLTSAVIEANVAGRPLVFLNACASARDSQAPPSGAWEATVSSVANAFLFGGAVAVVGTLADVSDRHAARLAEGFYRRVLEPTPIGEALRAARVECRENPESANSPTWLSFVLYGNPGQTLLRGGTVVPLPRLPVPRAPGPEAAAVSRPVAPAVPAPEPATTRSSRARRPRVVRLLGLLGLLALAVALGTWLPGHMQPGPPSPLVVGVMEVRARTPNVPSWMRELTRDGLNTILGKFPPIKVYSRQKIDFLQEKRHLSEIEAAEQLGMSKMLSAGVAVDEKNVTLDLDIVDIRSGLLEATERVVGPPDKLMELENELALRALRALGVDPTREQVQAIVASRGNETLDAYRMFTETFGGSAEPAAGEQRPPAASAPSGEPRPGAPATGPGTSWLSWQAEAWADEGDAEEAAIRAVFSRYGAALSARSVEQVVALQPGLVGEARERLAKYFEMLPDLQVRISDVDVLREGDEAVASYTRVDEFTDPSGRHLRLEHRLSAKLRRGPGGDWKIVALGAPQ
jgi:CHAT domain-containing protein/ketosteroid isomerase-like protein